MEQQFIEVILFGDTEKVILNINDIHGIKRKTDNEAALSIKRNGTAGYDELIVKHSYDDLVKKLQPIKMESTPVKIGGVSFGKNPPSKHSY